MKQRTWLERFKLFLKHKLFNARYIRKKERELWANSKMLELLLIGCVFLIVLLSWLLLASQSPYTQTLGDQEVSSLDVGEYIAAGEVREIGFKCRRDGVIRGIRRVGLEEIYFRADVFDIETCKELRTMVVENTEADEGSAVLNGLLVDLSKESSRGPLLFVLMLVVGVLLFFIFRRKNFKNKVRAASNLTGVKFADVGGCERAKEELEDVVAFLEDPEEFLSYGGSIPKGILLIGPPGTGKTLLARAVAGEANRPFFSITGADFTQIFVGTGVKNVDDLFKTAKDNAPCIIFIDEIDAVGRTRKASPIADGSQEDEKASMKICTHMDGFERSDGVIVIAATNRPDVLDPALTRSGRFDLHIVVDNPGLDARKIITGIHLKNQKVPIDPVIVFDELVDDIARRTLGLVGSDIEKIVKLASRKAARKKRKKSKEERKEKSIVRMEDFNEALNEAQLGGAKLENKILTGAEREIIAYHEAGHALIGFLEKETDPVEQVSIVPRGQSLGQTLSLPEEERNLHSQKFIEAQLRMIFGGRVAEELTAKDLSDITSAAEGDIQHATRIALNMVCKWGMAKDLGLVRYVRGGGGRNYLGQEEVSLRDLAEETKRKIDLAIQEILQEAKNTTTKLLEKNRDRLDALAQALLKHETLQRDEIEKILS